MDEVYVYCSNPDIQEFIPEGVKYLQRSTSLDQDTTKMNEVLHCFANEVPGVFENAKNADGFVEITKLKPGHRTRVEANCCQECRKIVINY